MAFSTNSYTSDTHFMVSDHRYEEFAKSKWYVDKTVRGHLTVVRGATKAERELGSPSKIYAHRQAAGTHLKRGHKHEEVDHLNRNTFDNRVENLQPKSTHGNSRNRCNNTGKGKGLWGASFHKKSQKWESCISINRKTIRPKPSMYLSEEEAHNAAVSLYRQLTRKDPIIALPPYDISICV